MPITVEMDNPISAKPVAAPPTPDLKVATAAFNRALRRYRAAQKRADERKVELDAAREIVMKAMAGAA